MALVSSTLTLAVAALVFFLGYFTAYEPYRALYPDAVGDEAAGRAQGTQALWRGAGTGLALLGGGLLLAVARGAPFLAAAVVYVLAMGLFVWALRRTGIPDQPRREDAGVGETARSLWRLVRGHESLQAFLIANCLWELSLAALKTFVVLYVTVGLGFLVPFLFTSRIVVAAAIPFIAALTGYYSFSRGLGTWLGPLLAGIAVTTTRSIFETTQGYQAVWGVCAVSVLLSLLPLEWLRRTVR